MPEVAQTIHELETLKGHALRARDGETAELEPCWQPPRNMPNGAPTPPGYLIQARVPGTKCASPSRMPAA